MIYSDISDPVLNDLLIMHKSGVLIGFKNENFILSPSMKLVYEFTVDVIKKLNKNFFDEEIF